MPDALTFRVDRLSAVSLTDQVAAGLRAAIRSGHFRTGDRLPSIRATAAALGVSQTVVRNAVKRLADSGDVVARPKSGIHVLRNGTAKWTRHVLFLQRSDTYYFATRNRHFAELLDAEGVRVTAVWLDSREYNRGLPHVRTVLDTQSVGLAAVSGESAGIASLLRERGIPFVSILDPSPSAQAAGVLALDMHRAFTNLACHFADCAIRTAAVVSPAGTPPTMLDDVFAEHGLQCQFFGSDSLLPGAGPDTIEQAGATAVRRILRQGPHVPDAVYFADDYACRGGLMALLEHGVRIPEDLQVVSLTNRGHTPSFIRPLTRLEMNPYAHAEAMEQLVLDALKTGRIRPRIRMAQVSLAIGETTRKLDRKEHSVCRPRTQERNARRVPRESCPQE